MQDKVQVQLTFLLLDILFPDVEALVELVLLLPLAQLLLELGQRALLLVEVGLGHGLLHMGGVVVGLAVLELRGAHEEGVELVGVALEEEGLGRVLVQHGDWVVHLKR